MVGVHSCVVSGESPWDIQGETNPTLSLVPGEEYTAEWTNIDDLGHNFEIADENNVTEIQDFMPDGALYLMEWESGFESTDESGIYRIEHRGSDTPNT